MDPRDRLCERRGQVEDRGAAPRPFMRGRRTHPAGLEVKPSLKAPIARPFMRDVGANSPGQALSSYAPTATGYACTTWPADQRICRHATGYACTTS